jgi:hypothetical protein
MFASYFVVTRKPTREGFRLSQLNQYALTKRSIHQKRSVKKVERKKSRFQDSESDSSSNDSSRDQTRTLSDDSEDQDSLEEEAELSEEHKIGLNVFEEYF